jgi:hypothetical protein
MHYFYSQAHLAVKQADDLTTEIERTFECLGLWDRTAKMYIVEHAAEKLPNPTSITATHVLRVIERSSELFNENETLRTAFTNFPTLHEGAALEVGVLMYVLETVTLAMDNQEFCSSLLDHWSQTAFLHLTTFAKLKVSSVIGIVGTRNMLEADLNQPGTGTLVLPLNILEAVSMDVIEGSFDNVIAGRRLIANCPESGDQNTRVSRMATTAAWNTVYVLWNLSFVSRFDYSSIFSKLLLPCVLAPCAPSADESSQQTFINYRGQSLLAYIMYMNTSPIHNKVPTESLRKHLGKQARMASERLLPITRPSSLFGVLEIGVTIGVGGLYALTKYKVQIACVVGFIGVVLLT